MLHGQCSAAAFDRTRLDFTQREVFRLQVLQRLPHRNQFVSLPAPALQQLLEDRQPFLSFQFGVQGIDMPGFLGSLRQVQKVLRHIFHGDAVAPDEFIQRRQGGGQLRAGDDLGLPGRDEGMGAARVGAVVETQMLGLAQGVAVGLPTGGGMGLDRKSVV